MKLNSTFNNKNILDRDLFIKIIKEYVGYDWDMIAYYISILL